MGKKDSTGQHCQPLAQYRKQIGKQDWKKSKKEIKTMKQRSTQNSEFTPQQIVLVIGFIITAVSGLYVLIAWYLGAASIENIKVKPPM